MENLPSAGKAADKVHEIKIAASYYDDVTSGRKRFELRKNDRGYKVGDTLKMLEFEDGKHTGRIIMLFYLAFLLNLNTPAAPLLYNCLNVQIGRQHYYAARSKLVLYTVFHFSVVLCSTKWAIRLKCWNLRTESTRGA